MYAQQEKYRTMQAFGGSPLAGWGMVAAYDRAFEGCMFSKGWEKVLKEKNAINQQAESSREIAKREQEKLNKQSDNPEGERKTITEDYGNKRQDAEAILSLLRENKKVALAIIIEDVNYAGVKPDKDMNELAETVKEHLLAELEYVHLYGFGKSPNFSLVDRAHLNALLKEHAFSQTGLVSDETKVKIGRLVGATHILLVKKTFVAEGNVSSLEYRRLLEVESAKVLAVGITREKKK